MAYLNPGRFTKFFLALFLIASSIGVVFGAVFLTTKSSDLEDKIMSLQQQLKKKEEKIQNLEETIRSIQNLSAEKTCLGAYFITLTVAKRMHEELESGFDGNTWTWEGSEIHTMGLASLTVGYHHLYKMTGNATYLSRFNKAFTLLKARQGGDGLFLLNQMDTYYNGVTNGYIGTCLMEVYEETKNKSIFQIVNRLANGIRDHWYQYEDKSLPESIDKNTYLPISRSQKVYNQMLWLATIMLKVFQYNGDLALKEKATNVIRFIMGDVFAPGIFSYASGEDNFRIVYHPVVAWLFTESMEALTRNHPDYYEIEKHVWGTIRVFTPNLMDSNGYVWDTYYNYPRPFGGSSITMMAYMLRIMRVKGFNLMGYEEPLIYIPIALRKAYDELVWGRVPLTYNDYFGTIPDILYHAAYSARIFKDRGIASELPIVGHRFPFCFKVFDAKTIPSGMSVIAPPIPLINAKKPLLITVKSSERVNITLHYSGDGQNFDSIPYTSFIVLGNKTKTVALDPPLFIKIKIKNEGSSNTTVDIWLSGRVEL